MNILITGGTGFIGSRLAIRCLKDGHNVRVLGRKNTSWEERNLATLEEQGIEVVLGSVTEPETLEAAVKNIDVVYHLAAAQHESNVPDQYFWDINVTGTRYMLEASVAAGVNRFVHGSTIGVYGSAASGEISPDTPTAPDNIYGITKREGEALALSYRDRLHLTVVRISETYGPGDSRLLKLFKGINKGYFFKIGPGDNLHHLIYVDDLVEGMVRTAFEENTIGEAYVIAGGEPISTDEMLDTISDVVDKKLLPFRMPMWPLLLAGRFFENTVARAGMKPPLTTRRMDFFRKTFYFNQAKTVGLIGMVATTSFAEGARQTMEWYVQNGML